MAAQDDVPPGREDRIELAVQREMARRRRLLRLYLLLLLIPVGVAVWLLAGGAESHLTSAVEIPVEVREAPQKIEKQAAEIEEQKRQVQAITERQKELQKQVTAVGSGLQELEPQLVAPQGGTERMQITALHRGLDMRLETLEQRLQKIEETQAALLEEQKKLAGDVEQLQKGRRVSPGIVVPRPRIPSDRVQPTERPPG